MADTVIIFTLVLNELGAVFVNCIVSEMHEEVFEIVVIWWHILFSGKTR